MSNINILPALALCALEILVYFKFYCIFCVKYIWCIYKYLAFISSCIQKQKLHERTELKMFSGFKYLTIYIFIFDLI